jgi:hypothetical protein
VTSIAAWAGVDSRGQSSLYNAGDSRITFPGGGSRASLSFRSDPAAYDTPAWPCILTSASQAIRANFVNLSCQNSSDVLARWLSRTLSATEFY